MRRCPATFRSLHCCDTLMSRHRVLASISRLTGHQLIVVRQTSRSRVNARPISSTTVINDSYTMTGLVPPLVPKHTASEVHELPEHTTQSIYKEVTPEETDIEDIPHSEIFTRSMSYITSNRSRDMIDMLTGAPFEMKKTMTTMELKKLVVSLSQRNRHHQIIELCKIFTPNFTKTPFLTKQVLQSTFKLDNFTLFEEMFTHYIQQPSPQAHYFNLALSVFLNTNTEFAKQLLYQMVYSSYPMDDDTLYVFLSITNRVGTFPTVRFALDLIKNNPKIPMSEKAYGPLVTGFLHGAPAKDMSQLTSFLKAKGMVDHEEVKAAYLVDELRYCDMEDAWEKIEQIETITQNVEVLQRCYENVFHLFYKKMNIHDLSRFLALLKMKGCTESPATHKRILENLGRGLMMPSIVHYIKLSKKMGHFKLNQFYVKALWKACVMASPDHAGLVTFKFRQLIEPHKRDVSWGEDAVAMLRLQKTKKKSHLPKSALFTQRAFRADELVRSKDERGLLSMVNDQLRDGLRPPIPFLKKTLQGLIELNSEQYVSIYELIQSLYSSVPVDIELTMLNKELKQAKEARLSRPQLSTILRRFLVKHSSKLHVKYYTVLSNIAIELGDSKLAIEIVAKARNADTYRIDKDTWRLYDSALRALTHNGVPNMFFSLMNHVAKDDELVLTREQLNNLKKYKKYFVSRKIVDLEEKRAFEAEFDTVWTAIIDKYDKQLKTTKGTIDEMVVFLKEWLKESIEKEKKKKNKKKKL